MSSTDTIVIVGSGLAGVTAAGTLRDAGFAGRVILVGAEPELPYDRPPLSKRVLVHDEYEALVASHLPTDLALRAPDNIALRPPGWYEQQRIELRLGVQVTTIDAAAHRVGLADGSSIDYARLILVPGARARRLPALENGPLPIAYLRTLRDAVRLRSQLKPGRRIVLLGGGVIGMEVAASAVLRECLVTVVELAARIMARALPEPVSDYIAAYHRAKGVTLHLGTAAGGQAQGTAPGLALPDGSVLPADLLVIGIGVYPDTELARSAGLHCDDGIVVDAYGATSAPDIYAAGDAVRYPDEFLGRSVRSENWMHAQNQAIVVARNVVGGRQAYAQVPHMWSDQYDLKIQVSGRYDAAEHVRRGELARNKFMVLHLEDGRLVGATGINEPRDMKYAQRLIEARVAVDPAQLADPAFNLKKAAGA
jgi:3-phenylpropionate/trans-cinnamate dioxygenase ferredoxin reductase component